MKKRIFSILVALCLMAGLMLAFAATAGAVDLTPDYYVTGAPRAYNVGSSANGSEVGVNCYTLANALSACNTDWGERPGRPVIQLGSSSSPLSVNRGDGNLISATYTGAVNIEYYSSQFLGLKVGTGVTATLRDFTLTNSVKADDTYRYDAIFVLSGGTLAIEDGTSITVADGTSAKSGSACALNNVGTVTISGTVIMSIADKTYTIFNNGSCTIGGNEGDNITISTSASAGTGIQALSGQLTIGTGTTVNAFSGLYIGSGCNAAISGGTVSSEINTVSNMGTLTITGGTLESAGALSGGITGTTLNNRGTLIMTGGTVRNTGTSGSCRALDNTNGTATISGGVITSGGTETIWTLNKLTLNGNCIVSSTASNGTAVSSNINTNAGSEISIGGNAYISGNIGVIASYARYGGTSTLTITGGVISGRSYAVQTTADTGISGGRLSATGPNSIALSCSDGHTVNITSGEFTSNGQYSAYGIINSGSNVSFSGGSVTAILTDSGGWSAYGIQNTSSGTVKVSGGSVTAGANVPVANAKIYGIYNNDGTANITGGVISSEGSSDTAFAVFDQASASPRGVVISGAPTLKSVSPNTVCLEKRTSDSGALTYFGTSFYANANASVTIQSTYDEAADAYVINGGNYTNTQAHALPDVGYGAPRWTSDAARTIILSTASPAAVSTLTAGGNASVYLSVRQVFAVTVSAGGHGTASANVSSTVPGDTVTLASTPNTGYSFDGWTSPSGVAFADASAANTTFAMPAKAVTVTANWEANGYIVTFDPESGTVSPDTKTVTYDSTYGALPVPERTRYTFGGWWTGDNGTGVQVLTGTTVTITADQTLHAKWTINTYTVTWKSQDGTTTLEEDTAAAYNSTPSFGSSKPTKASDGAYSYVFAGWATSMGATTGTAEASLGAVTNNIIYYAAFTATPLAYSACVSPVSKTFTAVGVGYGTVAAQQFTITNDGTGTITNLSATLTSGVSFEISAALSSNTLTSGSTTTVSVLPKTGLAVNTYTDTLSITGDNGISLTVPLSFTVNAAPIVNAIISPDTGSFDKRTANQADVTATVIWGSATDITTVKARASSIGAGNFNVSGNVLTIKKEYLAVQSTGSLVLTAEFDAGASATLTITVTDTTPPTLAPASRNYDLNAPADVGMIITWNNASNVTDAVYSIRPDVTIYTLDTGDYNIDDDSLTIESSFFSDLSLTTGATLDFVFTFNTGDEASLTVHAVDGFVPVTDIIDVPDTAAAGTPLTLTGTVVPGNATNQTVTWSVYNVGGTGASIAGNILSTTAAGVVVVRATIENGLPASSDYTQDFNITVSAAPIATYNVTFSTNGGTYATKTVNAGESIGNTAWPANPTRSSYTFGGWFTGGNGAGTEFTSATPVNVTFAVYAKWTYSGGGGGSNTPAPAEKTITVTETSSDLFKNTTGAITVEADVEDAFSNSVEVKVTDTTVDAASFGLGAVDEVYLFDISLYIKGTGEKTEPAPGYAVTIALPIPENLIDKRNDLSVVHKSDSGVVAEIASRPEQRNGVWYLVFEATEFSPYALVVRNVGTYDMSAGVPYYLDADGSRVFIGFAANGKYYAPSGVTISFTHNDKSFTDVPGHWAAQYIGFVTEREIFLGTGTATFSPDAGMTRAMFATVIGRLYERSFGAIKASGIHAFTDCDYSDYYGKYVDWAAENEIIGGYGNGKFGPNDKVTREQMAAILYRFANFLGVLPDGIDTVFNYPDADSLSDYAKTAALYCQTTGIIGGRTGGMFAPQETATRAEVATIIQRFVESGVK